MVQEPDSCSKMGVLERGGMTFQASEPPVQWQQREETLTWMVLVYYCQMYSYTVKNFVLCAV